MNAKERAEKIFEALKYSANFFRDQDVNYIEAAINAAVEEANERGAHAEMNGHRRGILEGQKEAFEKAAQIAEACVKGWPQDILDAIEAIRAHAGGSK